MTAVRSSVDAPSHAHEIGDGEIDFVSDIRHPARIVVPVLPGDDADALEDRYPWFVPEIVARHDARGAGRLRRTP